MGELINKLMEYKEKNICAFHMPGHKRKIQMSINPYSYDITEITGFDDLGESEDVLMRLEQRLAMLYNCDNAYILLNGSTSGVLAAISSILKPEEKILMGRNSHKSAYNAVFLRQIKSEYIYPQTNVGSGISLEINPKDVENKLLENNDVKAVYITSPTYEGVISDIKVLSEIVHNSGAVLIVDCAHGAHFGLDNSEYKNPLEQGADVVIMSLHKTLPSPTQTAVICTKGDRVKNINVKKFVNIYNSTSPSYLLMCGIENCLDIIENNKFFMSEYSNLLSEFRNKCLKLNNLYLFNPSCEYDKGKIVICTDRSNINGTELKDILLDDYGIELEMSSKNYAIAMTSFMDEKDDFDKLFNALEKIDKKLTKIEDNLDSNINFIATKEFELSEIEVYDTKECMISESIGEVVAEYIYIYPPGIPWIVPGEIISKEIVEKIDIYRHNGFKIKGIKDNKISVIKR